MDCRGIIYHGGEKIRFKVLQSMMKLHFRLHTENNIECEFLILHNAKMWSWSKRHSASRVLFSPWPYSLSYLPCGMLPKPTLLCQIWNAILLVHKALLKGPISRPYSCHSQTVLMPTSLWRYTPLDALAQVKWNTKKQLAKNSPALLVSASIRWPVDSYCSVKQKAIKYIEVGTRNE